VLAGLVSQQQPPAIVFARFRDAGEDFGQRAAELAADAVGELAGFSQRERALRFRSGFTEQLSAFQRQRDLVGDGLGVADVALVESGGLVAFDQQRAKPAPPSAQRRRPGSAAAGQVSACR